jgi:signal peptidase I
MMIKRIIAVAGDRIHIARGTVFLNGNPVAEPYVFHQTSYDPSSDSWPLSRTGSETRDIVVPSHSVFVMGDNREQSADSRVWGAVPESDIVGYVLLAFPASRRKGKCGVPTQKETNLPPSYSKSAVLETAASTSRLGVLSWLYGRSI